MINVPKKCAFSLDTRQLLLGETCEGEILMDEAEHFHTTASRLCGAREKND